MTIWRDNETLTYVAPYGNYDFPEKHQKYVTLEFFGKNPTLHIFGLKDKAIAQTAAFFMSLEEPNEDISFFIIRTHGDFFDFRAAGAQCLRDSLK